MTIELFRFSEGEPIKDLAKVDEQAAELLVTKWNERVTLPTGEYDVTPEVWTRYGSNLYRYDLVVNDDGTASQRMLPKDSGVGTKVVDNKGAGAFKRGGRIIRMPEDSNRAIIAGPKRGDPVFRIYGIVFYHPGQNPNTTKS